MALSACGQCARLLQIARRDGQDAWVLIHTEVQGQEEANFAQRMFRYYYRLLDRYDRQIMSVAVLGAADQP
jgi:hypothetical protein